jgi:hypothetical protein
MVSFIIRPSLYLKPRLFVIALNFASTSLRLLWPLVVCVLHPCCSQANSSQTMSPPEQVIRDELPKKTISGTCVTSEPRRECGLYTWKDTSCEELLQSYQWDPQSTCCSLSDLDPDGGCMLTVGGAGNFCTWREPGTTPTRFYTVQIMDISTSSCPDSPYKIPAVPLVPPSRKPLASPAPAKPSLLPSLGPSPKPSRHRKPIPTFPSSRPAKVAKPASKAPITNPVRGHGNNPPAPTTWSAGQKSGSCWATEPGPECGLLQVPGARCADVLQAYEWSGTCCSFLTVGGPRSYCTWKRTNTGGQGDGDITTEEEEYTMFIAGTTRSVCPPTKYTVPNGAKLAWDGPTPAPERSTASCWTTKPNDDCGYYVWSDSCKKVTQAYQWQGSCCSLSNTEDGGCRLTVDGPGSECTFLDAASEYTIFVSEEAAGTCPESHYPVLTDHDGAEEKDFSFGGPTPEPVESGHCSTLYPNDSCGIHAWNEPCSALITMYDWSGTCCSLSPRDEGAGCQLTVDGPGSTCTWKEKDNETYFNVVIDEQNDRSCPESNISALSGYNPGRSPFTACVAAAFGRCLTSCEDFSTFRQSFKACVAQDPTQALQCAAGAVSVCLEAKGRAPSVLCQRLTDIFSTGALHTADCLDLQQKCAAYRVGGDVCS